MKQYGVQTEHIVNHMEGVDSKILCLSEKNYNSEIGIYMNYRLTITPSFICNRDVVVREGKLVCHLDYFPGADLKARVKVINKRLFRKYKDSIILNTSKV